jgi:CBS domain-containing protein
MTTPAITIPPATSIHAARTLMNERRIRRLPVMQDDRLVGIVTLGDLRSAEPPDGSPLSKEQIASLLDKLPVSEVMSRAVFIVSPGTPIREAAGMMLVHRVSGLPVVHDGAVIGMITESDIFRMLVRTLEPTLPN